MVMTVDLVLISHIWCGGHISTTVQRPKGRPRGQNGSTPQEKKAQHLIDGYMLVHSCKARYPSVLALVIIILPPGI